MTTNTAALAAIRERADEETVLYAHILKAATPNIVGASNGYMRDFQLAIEDYVQIQRDRAALLAIVDELTARAEAAEAMAINIEDVTSYTYWGEGIDHDPPIAIVLNLEIEIEGEAYSFSTGLDYRHYDDPGAIIRALKGKRFTASDALAAHDANGESAGNGGA